VRGQLADARLALDEATRRRDEYRRQLEGVEPYFELEVAKPVARKRKVSHPLDGRIDSLETGLDQLLLQYTEKHPDVISTRSILADLVAQREAELEAMPALEEAPVQQASGLAENTVSQELSVALGAAEAEVAALDARVAEFNRREQELRKLVDTVPRIEAELARLNRDYEVNEKNYGELLKRRESLKLGEEANQSADGMQFNIIEPPRVPLTPIGPNRPLLSTAVLFVALAFGVGAGLMAGMLRPALYSKEDVEEQLQLPVIGTVTRVWTRGELLRRRVEVSTFVVGCVMLIGLFTGLLVIEINHDDFLQKVRNLDVIERVWRMAGTIV
jgi:polysaccharide chain length determinant protein (PEP-CTERM system associated)